MMAVGSAVLALACRGETDAQLDSSVERVLILGDSITYDGRYVADLQAYFVVRYPNRRLEFMNLGLPSETVSGLSEAGHAGGRFPRPDLHERLARVLPATRPDLVFACYGMNDGIYLPLDPSRFQAFQDGMQWLHGEVTRTGASILHVTPPVFDGARMGNPHYNGVLGRYADWMLEQHQAAGWQVVDLHGPMTRALEDRRKADPAFAFARDGVHPGDEGHAFMARQILLHLGAADLEPIPPADPKLLALVRRRLVLMRDAWLTQTGHTRPGLNAGLPMEEAIRQAEALDQEILQGNRP